jgi:hypothetical protein
MTCRGYRQTQALWLHCDVDWSQEGSDTQITVPPQLPRQPAHVLTITKPA